MDKKKEYLNKLLSVINSLYISVSAAEQEESISFSFFKDSFSKSQEIMNLIHDLEMFQIEDMKKQMERLITFLSENENNKSIQKEELIIPISKIEEEKTVASFVLPVYVNPNASNNEVSIRKEDLEVKVEENNEDLNSNNTAIPSINDVVKTPHSKIEVKRGLSLNDRFFFQRELFNNDREAMNSMMIKINAFNTYIDIEKFVKDNTTWDLEDENVKSFLDIVSKGIY